MNWNALWGTLLVVYAIAVYAIAYLKPEPVWKMGKIQGFVKVLGEKGTVIFFYVWGTIALGFGIWFFVTLPVG